ncbi:tetratricopeptide repeat protein [Streptomyces sp. TLI_55]|uniref:FxSxx-COOH system tetratricopeptide repeat protein n=1 Tax=Streptomyces sp. TLI_55 TaxID=1938861 RepID=UPI000BD10E24|nr:FxSxx-COOH system tetratricopeptide repeat protein [Streptomyces sp. TLI_55]SNX56408.1 tetratricopeptide repeat protein [Streptomyces sp. TLI_55]
MISDLLALLAQGGVDDPTPEELADILWLAQQVLPQGLAPGDAGDGTDEGSASGSAPGGPTEHTPAEAESGPDYEVVPADEDLVDIHVPGGDHDEGSAGPGGTPVRIPAAGSLPHTLALTRALKPLTRKVPSRTAFELDEEATVARVVDEDILLPVLRPEPARWLSLALVVDSGPSMSLWQDEIHELQHEVARLGAFRNLRRWNLLPSADGDAVELRPHPAANRPARHPREVVDPAGAQLIVVLSDTAGTMWRTGAAHRLLADWARHSQVALAHLLPAALWSRVGLVPTPARLHIPQPGLPNSRWRSERLVPTDPGSTGIPVPVVDLVPRSLRAWAEMTSGSGRWTKSAALFVPGVGRAAPRRSVVPAGAAETIRRFRVTASPHAWKLAGLLSAHSPVTVPLARLVQRAMLGDASRGDLAEVFLGGLLRRTAEPSVLGELRFEFDPEVREALLGAQYRDDVEAVRELVRTQVTAYLRPRFGSPRSVRGVLADPARQGGVTVVAEGEAYARASRGDLMRMGATVEAARAPQEESGDEADGRERVFISYAGADRAWAEWVAWQLQEAGFGVELDVWHWRVGDNLVWRTSEALERADTVVALFSRAYFEQGHWTEMEAVSAIAGEGRLIPLVVEPLEPRDIPALLAAHVRSDLHSMEEPEALSALLRAVSDPTPPAERPRFPATPERSHPMAPRLPSAVHAPHAWNVRRRNADFVGREDVLRHVREALLEDNRPSIQVLHGLGGVGKSQIAVEYAHRFAGQYDIVWWIAAEQTDRLPAAYAELADRLGLTFQETGIKHNARTALDHLRERGRWLIIFDNSEDPSALRPWLPEGPGHVLITSRNPSWRSLSRSVALDTFSRADSVLYLTRQLPDISEAQANALAEQLGDLPLALAQAVGVVAEGMPVDSYRAYLLSGDAELLRFGEGHDYPVSLVSVVRLSAERLALDHPDSVQLLDFGAFFGPDPIPLAWLKHMRRPLSADTDDDRSPSDLLTPLARHGLVRVDENCFQIHRLTQTVQRGQVEPARAAELREGVTSVLEAAAPGSPDLPELWPQWEAVTAHLLGRPILDESGQFALCHTLLGSVRYLTRSGRVLKAQRVTTGFHELWSSRLGADHPDTLAWAASLAEAEAAVGQYAHAHELARDVLERRRRVLGEDHPDTIASTTGVAELRAHLAEYEEARHLYEDALQRSRRMLGEENPFTLASSAGLAVTLVALDEPGEARRLLEDILARQRRVLGEDHPDTLSSAYGLVVTFRSLQEHLQARLLAQDVLERCRRILGDDHPISLTVASALAVTVSDLGEQAEARPLAEACLLRLRHTLGEDHPTTLEAVRVLAVILNRLGYQRREATVLLEDALTRSRRMLGADHPITRNTLQDLAATYQAMGLTRAAQKLLASRGEGNSSRRSRR